MTAPRSGVRRVGVVSSVTVVLLVALGVFALRPRSASTAGGAAPIERGATVVAAGGTVTRVDPPTPFAAADEVAAAVAAIR